jgi:2-polyprenyl-3-methyl-5-hydroxy-6-metoxy-1,4-benzoquinol methylase
MSYAGLIPVSSATEAHLGGNIREGDPFTFSPKAWDYAADRFAIKTILDLGSGLGYSSQYFFNRGKQVIAVDGLKENIEKAIYPTIEFDLERGPVNCLVDLVHCQEVVEHIDEKYLENLLQSLACGKFILMTHALPGQGGHHHVNEKPSEYWIGHMARYQCTVLEEDTKRIRKLAADDGALYLARTGMLFANKRR